MPHSLELTAYFNSGVLISHPPPPYACEFEIFLLCNRSSPSRDGLDFQSFQRFFNHDLTTHLFNFSNSIDIIACIKCIIIYNTE